MKLVVGKLGESQDVPGNNPFHAFALAVENEFNRLKGSVGRDYNASLVGKSGTPFGQLHTAVPFKPGDTSSAQAQRPSKSPKQQEQQQAIQAGVSYGAGFSTSKKGKRTPEAAAVALSATAPLNLKNQPIGARPTENLSRKEIENLRLAVRRPLVPATQI